MGECGFAGGEHGEGGGWGGLEREKQRQGDAKDKEEKARGRLGHQQVYLSICLFVNIFLIMFLSFLSGLHYVIASCGKRHNR